MNDACDPSASAVYERAMRRLRVAIRLLTVVLLALVARSVSDGPNLAGVITGTMIALLLTASIGLRRQGRRMRPDDARQSGGNEEKGAPARAMACAPQGPV